MSAPLRAKIEAENRVNDLLEKLDKIEQAILYAALHRSGYRMSGIEVLIERLAKEKAKAA
jgi:hypothetical protein